MLYSCPTLGLEIVSGRPVIMDMLSPEEKPDLLDAARNGSCMYSGSIGDSL
jgi:hypothetical protein